MKKSKINFALLGTFLFLLVPQVTLGSDWRLGVVVGSPTGLSANYFFDEHRTLHTTLGYSFSDDDTVELAAHHTWRKDSLNFENINLGWFYGLGASAVFVDRDHGGDHDDDHPDDHIDAGPSATLGLFHDFTKLPLEIFLKGDLTLNIVEDTDVETGVMVGLHYIL